MDVLPSICHGGTGERLAVGILPELPSLECDELRIAVEPRGAALIGTRGGSLAYTGLSVQLLRNCQCGVDRRAQGVSLIRIEPDAVLAWACLCVDRLPLVVGLLLPSGVLDLREDERAIGFAGRLGNGRVHLVADVNDVDLLGTIRATQVAELEQILLVPDDECVGCVRRTVAPVKPE